MPLRALILGFDGVELLDLAGPFEVFSVAAQLAPQCVTGAVSVASGPGLVRSIGGLGIAVEAWPQRLSADDLLLLPGGAGSRALLDQPATLDWIASAAPAARAILSICSGARLLAASGLLRGRPFTTHHQVFDDVLALEPSARPCREARVVDDGRVLSAAGISAGIDAALHLLAREAGMQLAQRVAAYMEYRGDWQTASQQAPQVR